MKKDVYRGREGDALAYATPGEVRHYLRNRGARKDFIVDGNRLHQQLDLAALSFKIPHDRLSRISDGRIGLRESQTIVALSHDAENPTQPIVSLCEGLGNTSSLLAIAAGAGVEIISVESDAKIAEIAKYNVDKAGYGDQVSVQTIDAFDFLRDAQNDGRKYRAIFLDPPWPADTNTRTFSSVIDVNPFVEEMINDALTVSPVVAFRLPGSLTLQQLRTIAYEQHETIVHTHTVEGSENFRTHTVFLVKGCEGFSSSDMFLPKGEDTAWIEKSTSG